MSNPAVNPQLDASEWEPKYPFDLVVAYEDTLTRQRALQLYDHLAPQLLNDYDFQCSWWKFDHLQNATLRSRAADAAVEANMIILSIRAQPEISPLHRVWLEDWIPRRDNSKAALVALIAGTGKPGNEAAPMLAFLQNAARQGRMDFFTQGFDLAQPNQDSLVDQITKRASVSTPIAHQILQQPMSTPRWGINE
jgi:hypothetical protein